MQPLVLKINRFADEEKRIFYEVFGEHDPSGFRCRNKARDNTIGKTLKLFLCTETLTQIESVVLKTSEFTKRERNPSILQPLKLLRIEVYNARQKPTMPTLGPLLKNKNSPSRY